MEAENIELIDRLRRQLTSLSSKRPGGREREERIEEEQEEVAEEGAGGEGGEGRGEEGGDGEENGLLSSQGGRRMAEALQGDLDALQASTKIDPDPQPPRPQGSDPADSIHAATLSPEFKVGGALAGLEIGEGRGGRERSGGAEGGRKGRYGGVRGGDVSLLSEAEGSLGRRAELTERRGGQVGREKGGWGERVWEWVGGRRGEGFGF